ncbi:MAG: DUF3987 domain-containing protein [Nitrospinae bacterium]|nr:DUF3987 domain-containing protein [Nitrospinota bacterium]MBF0633552.1 DUF3987 domain-containing protein [Nitrospinota bacterium]
MTNCNTNEAENAAKNLTASYINQGYTQTGLYRYDEKYYRIRLDNPAPKDGQRSKLVYPLSKNGHGWELKEPEFHNGKKPLYRKNEIALNPEVTVYVCEGEKCADALDGIGLVAVTSGSSSSANSADWEPLKGRNVVIWPDSDEPGQRYADAVESRLLELGCHVERIDVVALNLPEGGDVVDWLKSNHEATKTDVEKLPRMAPKSKGDDWPEPIALDAINLPELPRDVLKGWLGGQANAVSQATETPPELAAGFGLAVTGIATQKKFCVMPEPGYFEPLSIWAITILESGNRKSAVMQAMTKPLTEWERDKADELKPELERIQSERRTAEARIQNLRAKAAKMKDAGEYERAKHEIVLLESTLPQIPTPPRLCTQDVTSERTGSLMFENDERIGIISAEGGMFDTAAGRYSGGVPNFDIYLQGHAGDPVRVDRQGREPVFMNAPALTIGLSPQPDVIRRLVDTPSFRGRGFLARPLYFLPQSPLGRRTLESRPVPKNITYEYDRAIRRLLEVQPAIGDDGRPRPHVLRFTPEAHAEWKAMARHVEREMREGGKFEHVKDWAGKLPGACARLAGLLHVAENAFDEPWAHEISADTMSRALSLGAVYSQHALAVFDLIGADESLDAARRVYRWIQRTQPKTFTGRDCFDALKGHFKNMAALEPGLSTLAERSIIRALDRERKPGRPSQKFAVNPRIVEGWK